MRKLNNRQLNDLYRLAEVIRVNSEPLPNHPDKQSHYDCWDFLLSDIEALVNEVKEYRGTHLETKGKGFQRIEKII